MSRTPTLVRRAPCVPRFPIAPVLGLLHAAAHPRRLQILLTLAAGPSCVGDLASAVELPQSKVSSHLKLMRLEGLIEARREGRRVVYELAEAGAGLARLASRLGSVPEAGPAELDAITEPIS